ncbi:hypothetical protein Tco_0454178 [Tanacetum coccineum]
MMILSSTKVKNDNQTRTIWESEGCECFWGAAIRESCRWGPVVHQSGIQCFNCKEFESYAKECRKPKRVKDLLHYHKEKMLLCKQAEKGVMGIRSGQHQAEQSALASRQR